MVTPFDRFWSAYPRRVGKRAAERAYHAAVNRLGQRLAIDCDQFIIDRAAEFAKARAGQDPRYTPHPATWLNQDRFDDDDTPPASGLIPVARPNVPIIGG